MESIDKMTLELLMNRTNYNKYVEKTDPKKFEEYKLYKQKVRKYKSRILGLTRQYLDNPDFQLTIETNDSFADYAKTLIKHFEMNDLENECVYGGGKGKEKDEDILFDPTEMTSFEQKETRVEEDEEDENEHDNDEEDTKETIEKTGKSFWSKDRVVKSRTTSSRFTMDMYAKKMK
jgi:hypothetical protein